MRKHIFTISLFAFLILAAASLNAQVRVQTGIWNADKTISNYMLAAGGENERTVNLSVSFPKPFNTKPEVILSVTRYDGDANIGTRYEVKLISVHKAGFTLEAKTWGGTKINLIGGTWMAVGE